MAYKALYNKYRPQTFEEVAGQHAIVRTLRNAINNNKIAHAYLFCGPRGTGKTSMARLFAKALNCEAGIGHQCCQCENCVQLANGSHPDVIEIDAASNNGVDQVRDLIEQVRYSPIKGRYKVYIIDEVHMMSTGAFNALLKTLEEPPERVIFILATTEPYKVLPTITSRCQRYDFGKIEPEELKKKLVWVLKEEHVEYEEEGLDEIVRLADGGMRDALSILDQVLAYGGNELHASDVLAVFGLTSITEKINLLKTIASGDVTAVLGKFDSFLQAGIDIVRLAANLLDVLKDLLIFEKTGSSDLIASLTAGEASDLSKTISAEKANEMIQVLLKAQADFKSVGNVRSLFELTLLQLASLFTRKSASAPAPAPVKEEPKPVIKEVEKPQIQPTAPVILEKPKPEPIIEEKPAPAPIPEPAPAQPKPYQGTKIPSFFFEPDTPVVEKKPEVIQPAPAPAKEEPKPAPAPAKPASGFHFDFSKVPSGSLVKEGTPIELSSEEAVKIMVLGTKFKNERKELHDRWPIFQEAALDLAVGEAAQLLADGAPFCLCKDALLINYNFPKPAAKFNLKENQEILSALASQLVGRKVFVYALNRQQSVDAQNLFYNLRGAKKLPEPEEITLNLPM